MGGGANAPSAPPWLRACVIHYSLETLSTDDGDGNGDVGTERKDWGENAVVARILNIKHFPNLQT